mmetsp:Transcript_25427/g.55161  ORF Transcript_25427/g.55161 Transcript_25427/m.55161 type:complete len:107 (+) Transcript_25427:451-771(+)
MFINYNMIVLEPVSEASSNHASATEAQKQAPAPHEGLTKVEPETAPRKRKKKGVNPLSCKKSKKPLSFETGPPVADGEPTKKRTRRRKRARKGDAEGPSPTSAEGE